MTAKRFVATGTAMLAGLLTLGAPAAQADPPADPDGTRVTLAAAPTTTPAVQRIYFTKDSPNPPGCPPASGYACAVVPYGGGYYLFKFYRYGTYALHNWYGVGIFGNSQTGGAGARYYDSAGKQLGCVPTPPPRRVDWKPVASIRLTVSGC